MSPASVSGLGEGGQRLWRGLVTRDPSLEDGPMGYVALEACRARDRIEELDLIADREPMLSVDRKGRVVVHPAVVESRLQILNMLQLISALRLPDPLTGRRPQYRGPRGVYRPRNPYSTKSASEASRGSAPRGDVAPDGGGGSGDYRRSPAYAGGQGAPATHVEKAVSTGRSTPEVSRSCPIGDNSPPTATRTTTTRRDR